MKGLIFFSVFIFNYFSLVAQNNHSDCKNAIFLDGNSYSISELKGFGEILEFSGNELGNEYYFTEEHNSIWFSFTSPYEGEFTFTITPNNPSEDWDFILFKAGINQCDAIKSKEISPLRSNLARNDLNTAGFTGLDITSFNAYSPAGINPNMSKLLEVKENESFLLVIDNNKPSQHGFKLELKFKKFEKEIHIEKEHQDDESFAFFDMTEETVDLNKIEMKFIILEKGTNKPLFCQTEIVGVQWSDSNLKYDDVSSFSTEIPKDKWFYINVKKEGYTFGIKKIRATEMTEGNTHTIYLSEIKKGNLIVLNEIVFSPNTTHLLPSSINALSQLIDFMNEYPTAIIEVQGHVNAPGYKNEGKVKKFSLKRADQIRDYLVDAGIENNRIEISGKGNEFMVYPNPSNYNEEKTNRRVEIEILKY